MTGDTFTELAVFRPRQPGALRIVMLRDEPRDDAGQPLPPDRGGGNAVKIAFRVPTPLEEAAYEGRAQETFRIVQENTTLLLRYGFSTNELSDDELSGLREIVFLTEAAVELWEDWNVAIVESSGGDAPPAPLAKLELTAVNIAKVLGDRRMRLAWNVHLDEACSLERAEGNAYAVSPNTTSGEAANTADVASGGTTPAPAASPEASPGSSAPESASPPAGP